MAEVRPFRAVRYNSGKEALANVICPPYDVISPEREKELLDSNPHNYIRIEYARSLPGDNDRINHYTRVRALLEEWLNSEVLRQDDKSAYYLHEHTFTYEGKSARRLGLFARVRLEEWDKMIIRPHERTLAGPKRDRIKLISTIEANTSPVFSLYHDPEREVAGIIEQVRLWSETLEFAGEDGEYHRLWVVDDLAATAAIEKAFAGKPLYIADGHHRYESALAYRNESYAANTDISTDAALNFVMMSLTDMADPGMLILPTHRLLKGIDAESLKNLPRKLHEHFQIKHCQLAEDEPWKEIEPLLLEDSSRFFIYGLSGEGGLLNLTVKDPERVKALMPREHTTTYKNMDVSVVDHVVLEKVLGLNAMDEELVAYDHDLSSSIARVDSGEFQIAFILKPVHPETIQSISDTKDRMPRKSTYFYPKIPSGLVLYRLRD